MHEATWFSLELYSGLKLHSCSDILRETSNKSEKSQKISKTIKQGAADCFRSDCKGHCTKLLFLICIHRNEIHRVEVSYKNKPFHTCNVSSVGYVQRT